LQKPEDKHFAYLSGSTVLYKTPYVEIRSRNFDLGTLF